MYLAATRILVSKEAKHVRPWHFQLQYKGSSDTRLSTTRYILEPPFSRSYKHNAKYYKATTKFASLPKPFIFSPLASSSTNKSLSMPCLNGQIECSLYSVASECLGPIPDDCSTEWFVKSKRGDEADDTLKELVDKEKELPIKEAEKTPESLETLRKKVKSENLKDPNVPPGWEKRK